MNELFNALGVAGAVIVTYSNLPQIVLFVRQGHAKGISVSSTWIGFLGVALRTIFLVHTVGLNFIVLVPYFFSLLCIIITIYYLTFPRE